MYSRHTTLVASGLKYPFCLKNSVIVFRTQLINETYKIKVSLNGGEMTLRNVTVSCDRVFAKGCACKSLKKQQQTTDI